MEDKFYVCCPNPECGHKDIAEIGSPCAQCAAPMEPDEVEPEDFG